MAASNIVIRGVEGEKHLNKFSGDFRGRTHGGRLVRVLPVKRAGPVDPVSNLDGFTVSGQRGYRARADPPRKKGLFWTWTRPKVDQLTLSPSRSDLCRGEREGGRLVALGR